MTQALVDQSDVVLSALQLVTSLPCESGASPSFCQGRALVTRADRSSVPAPLLFSPLAYSLERRARQVRSLAATRAVRRENVLAQKVEEAKKAAEQISRELVGAAQEHMLGTLRALDEFGAALRFSLHLPQAQQEQIASWKARGDAAFAAVLPSDNVAGIVIGQSVFNFLNIYNTLLVVRLVLTWFPEPPAVIVRPLSTICDPYLNLFRGIIPPLGGTLDFSPILAFVILNVFTNAASAIPAEMPKDGEAGGAMPQPMVHRGKGPFNGFPRWR